MKKQWMVLLALVLMLSTAVSAAAEPANQDYDESKVFNLVNESTGYQLYFPHFVKLESRVLESEDGPFEATILVLNVPAGQEDVLLFEVLTSDPEAHYIDISVWNDEGLAAMLDWETFDNGVKGIYKNRYSFDEYFKNKWMHANIYSYNEDGELLWHFYDIYFIFEDQADAAEEQADQAAEPQPAPAAPAEPVVAVPNASAVVVNGEKIAFEAYTINGNNYFKLRDLAMAVNGTEKQFEVKWDGAKNAISLLSGEAYTPAGGELAVSDNPSSKTATPTSSKIYVDGEEVQFTAYTIGGNNYFKLRDIAKVFNIGVTWDGEANTVGIDTSLDYQG